MGSTAPRSKPGLTLVEVVVALLILGFATAMVLPTVDRGRSASEELARLVERARLVAASRMETVEITLFLEEGTVEISSQDPTSTPTPNGSIAPSRGARLIVTVNPLGRTESRYITAGSNDAEPPIVIDRWTGKARVRNP